MAVAPGRSPQDQVKNAADRSTSPGLDRTGGSAAVPDDSGFQARFSQWQTFLARPEVRAGLLQFSTQILQTNPGGIGPAIGTSIASGLGAAGRVTKNKRERNQEQVNREAESRQLQLENDLAERKQVDRERQTEILGLKKAGKGAKSRITIWRDHFESGVEIGEPALDPSTLTRLSKGAAAAETDPDGDVMAAALAVGLSPRQVAETYLDPQLRLDLKNRLGIGVGAAVPAPDGVGVDQPVDPRIPQITLSPDESEEEFAARVQEREEKVSAREARAADKGEPQRLRDDTANRQDQIRNRVQEELASGQRTVEEIAEVLIARGFTDKVSLDLLQTEFPQLWDIVTAKLAGG